MKIYKKIPNGLKWEIMISSKSYDYPFYAIIYDPKETIASHYYKTGWWGGTTINEAKSRALLEISRRLGENKCKT